MRKWLEFREAEFTVAATTNEVPWYRRFFGDTDVIRVVLPGNVPVQLANHVKQIFPAAHVEQPDVGLVVPLGDAEYSDLRKQLDARQAAASELCEKQSVQGRFPRPFLMLG